MESLIKETSNAKEEVISMEVPALYVITVNIVEEESLQVLALLDTTAKTQQLQFLCLILQTSFVNSIIGVLKGQVFQEMLSLVELDSSVQIKEERQLKTALNVNQATFATHQLSLVQ